MLYLYFKCQKHHGIYIYISIIFHRQSDGISGYRDISAWSPCSRSQTWPLGTLPQANALIHVSDCIVCVYVCMWCVYIHSCHREHQWLLVRHYCDNVITHSRMMLYYTKLLEGNIFGTRSFEVVAYMLTKLTPILSLCCACSNRCEISQVI